MRFLVHSIEEALEELKKYASEDVYVIGGDSIYAQMLPYCDTAHVTKIDFGYEADAWFPNLDENEEWKIAEESEEQTYFNLEYSFVKYVRKIKKKNPLAVEILSADFFMKKINYSITFNHPSGASMRPIWIPVNVSYNF